MKQSEKLAVISMLCSIASISSLVLINELAFMLLGTSSALSFIGAFALQKLEQK